MKESRGTKHSIQLGKPCGTLTEMSQGAKGGVTHGTGTGPFLSHMMCEVLSWDVPALQSQQQVRGCCRLQPHLTVLKHTGLLGTKHTPFSPQFFM